MGDMSVPELAPDPSKEDEQDLGLDNVFPEPERPPTPEPSTVIHTREVAAPNVRELHIRLVGAHPLWGHHLWNSSRALANYIDAHPALARGKCVLELGAGGALPGIVAALNGARHVVLTDYADAALVANIEYNVLRNVPRGVQERVFVHGYTWGQPAHRLLEGPPEEQGGFDLLILSDLIFNHSQHDALLTSLDSLVGYRASPPVRPAQPGPHPAHAGQGRPKTPRPDDAERPSLAGAHDASSSPSPADRLKYDELRPTPAPQIADPTALVFFTHHRPHLAARDLQFFERARGRGWVCERVGGWRFDPMFPDDPGEEGVRATVHGWAMTRAVGQGEESHSTE